MHPAGWTLHFWLFSIFDFLRRVGVASFEHSDCAVPWIAIKVVTLLCSPKHHSSPLDGL